MASKSKHRRFMALLGSPLSIGPIVLGLGGAMVLWAMSDRSLNMAAFVAILGSSVGLGMLATLMVFNPPRIAPELARKRQELAAGLEALADTGWATAAAESGTPATPGAPERL
jgi:hypothetical protein